MTSASTLHSLAAPLFSFFSLLLLAIPQPRSSLFPLSLTLPSWSLFLFSLTVTSLVPVPLFFFLLLLLSLLPSCFSSFLSHSPPTHLSFLLLFVPSSLGSSFFPFFPSVLFPSLALTIITTLTSLPFFSFILFSSLTLTPHYLRFQRSDSCRYDEDKDGEGGIVGEFPTQPGLRPNDISDPSKQNQHTRYPTIEKPLY